jgi:hypothetical protein
MAPKNMAHFVWSKTETILQIHGIGPFASTVVEPVYELTDKGIFSLTSLLLPGSPTSSNPPDCFALKVKAKVRSEAGEGIVVARGLHLPIRSLNTGFKKRMASGSGLACKN